MRDLFQSVSFQLQAGD